MATASEFCVGLANKLIQALAAAGWTPAEVNRLAENPACLQQLRGNVPAASAAGEQQLLRLRRMATITLPEQRKAVRPSSLFSQASGIEVSSIFRDLVLDECAGCVVLEVNAVRISSHQLLVDSTQAQIFTSLKKGRFFPDAATLLVQLAGMISRQKNGEEGDLPVDGASGIFFVDLRSRPPPRFSAD